MNRDAIRVIAARSAIACSTRARETAWHSRWSAVIPGSTYPPILDDYGTDPGPLAVRASGHRLSNSQKVRIPIRPAHTYSRNERSGPSQPAPAFSPGRSVRLSKPGQPRTYLGSPDGDGRKQGR